MLQLDVVVFLTGVLTVFFDVAYQTYLPSLVAREQLIEGNSKLQASESAAQIVGPALAGILYQVLRAGAIVADAGSYVWSALCVILIRSSEPEPRRYLDGGGAPIRLRTQIGEGWRYVVHHRYLRSVAACTALSNLFSSMLFALFFTYAVRRLHLSPATIGLVFAIGSVGFLLGALCAQRVSARIGIGPAIVWSAFLIGPPTLLVPLAPQRSPLLWLAASLLVISFGIPIYNISQVSLRQSICPPRLQGRMNATMRFMVWGTQPVGALVGAVLGSDGVLGLRPTLFIAAGGQLVCFLPVLLSPVRSLRSIPEVESDITVESGTTQIGDPTDGDLP